MAAPQNFRSAFNGFHREDVVNYIAYMTNQNETKVNQLNAQIAQLQQEMEALREQNRRQEEAAQQEQQLSQELEQTKQQLTQQDEQIRHLEEELREEKQKRSVQEQPKPDPVRVTQELNAYRRAESAERRAREQVGQMYDHACGTLADASVTLEEAAQRICGLEEQLLQNIAQLQEAVAKSKTELADAAVTIASIRPESQPQ